MSSNTSIAASNQMELNPFTNKAYSANFHTLYKIAQSLPVSQQIPRLLSTLQQNSVMVVVGETGSGKTTQLPKAILQADAAMKKPQGKKLALTQNRRLAAQLVCTRCL
jgi:HrpA-like RNA helicase